MPEHDHERRDPLAALGLTPATMSADMLAEGEALVAEIAAGPDEVCRYYSDLMRHLDQLDHEERGAAWHTLEIAAGQCLQQLCALYRKSVSP